MWEAGASDLWGHLENEEAASLEAVRGRMGGKVSAGIGARERRRKGGSDAGLTRTTPDRRGGDLNQPPAVRPPQNIDHIHFR